MAANAAVGHRVIAARFELTPPGRFDLATATDYFGGWPQVDGMVVMPFPVEGWRTSAAVAIRQDGNRILGDVHQAGPQAERAWRQALAAVSLDVDGSGFEEVKRRDPVIGRLWREHGHLRPVLFLSPYEAACAFVIGHRITILQARKLRQQMAERVGVAIRVGRTTLHAFPDPGALLGVEAFPGIAASKIERLHGVARAALEGRLDRDRLRAMPEREALLDLRTLSGIGPFFAEGILARGAGLTDFVTDDDLTPRAVQLAYGLKERPSHMAVLQRAEAWRPFRMWAVVLLHVWLRRQPKSVIGRRKLR